MNLLKSLVKKIPLFSQVYGNYYFAWNRSYANLLRKSRIQPGPKVVHWLSTYRCNSNCEYCEASANEKDSEELSTNQVKKIIDDLASIKTKHFFATGGEPMLRQDLFEILSYAKRLGMTVGMITNSLLFEKYKKNLKEIGLASIWTSVDGLEEVHDKNRGYAGAYTETLKAISYYKEINIPRRVVNTMVHPGNLDELPQLFEELKAAGINKWRLALAIPVGRGADEKWALSSKEIEDTFQFVERLRRYRNFNVELSEELGYLGCWDSKTKNFPFLCPAGLVLCAIMPDGDVLPCSIVYDGKYSEGNVKKTPIQEIWSKGFSSFRNGQLTGECTTCLHKKACSGGCWGRMVTEGKCLRELWDPNNYGPDTTSQTSQTVPGGFDG